VSYYGDDYDYGLRRDGTPYWYEETSKPCSCGVKPKEINTHVGYSDFFYWQNECPQCGHTWCEYLEG